MFTVKPLKKDTVTQELKFVMTKEDILDFAMRYDGNLQKHISQIIMAQDVDAIKALMLDIVKTSYKGNMNWDEITESKTYEQFWGKLIYDSRFSRKFINSILMEVTTGLGMC